MIWAEPHAGLLCGAFDLSPSPGVCAWLCSGCAVLVTGRSISAILKFSVRAEKRSFERHRVHFRVDFVRSGRSSPGRDACELTDPCERLSRDSRKMDKSSSSSTASSPGSSSSGRDINAAPGCGSSDLGTIPMSTPPPPPPINLNITTTTGGSFTVLVDAQNSVENLKKIIAKKLKVAKDRICLLHRERELHVGTLKDNGLADGSKIILIPNVETGLLAQRPENTVMQALESLNDAQVNDFLSGKTPLNLSMRLGDHMMLIQLQLSTVNPSSPSHTNSRSRSSQRSSSGKSSTSSASTSNSTPVGSNNLISGNQQHTIRKSEPDANNSRHNNSSSLGLEHLTSSRLINSSNSQEGPGETTSSQTPNNVSSVARGLSIPMPSSSVKEAGSPSSEERRPIPECCSSSNNSSFPNESLLEQSPIKSLSNLVSSPIKTTSITNIPTITSNFNPIDSNSNSNANDNSRQTLGTVASTPSPSCSDPISAKLTSCLCKRLSSNNRNCDLSQCQTRQDTSMTPVGSSCSYANNGEMCSRRMMATSTPNSSQTAAKQSGNPAFLHKTANNPIVRSKHHRHHHHSHHHHPHHHYASSTSNMLRKAVSLERNRTSPVESPTTIASASENTSSDSLYDLDDSMSTISATDSRALAEASRNLTQTLRKLSKEVFTSKVDLSDETPRKSGSGAVIESMKNHGKGIYSGTFSGTLNPALQDRYGRPKRDISTVIHILNDLLSATPQYSRGARICFESPSSSKSGKVKSLTSNDGCNKCYSVSKSSNCVYGECNGHYSGSNTASSSNTCHRSSTTGDNCSCCAQDSGFSFETSQSLISSSECSSLVSNSADVNSSNNTSSSCTCSFLRSSKNTSSDSLNATLQDINTSSSADKTICSKCVAELENNKTKCKLDQLRLVMQQSKQRREARKLKGAPYGARVVSTSTSATNGSPTTSPNGPAGNTSTSSAATGSTIAPLASPSEVSPNHIVEEVNTLA